MSWNSTSQPQVDKDDSSTLRATSDCDTLAAINPFYTLIKVVPV